MKRTTTREYDEQGRVTKEVVTEETTPEPAWGQGYPFWSVCTCGYSTAGCPLHPRWGTTWTSPYVTFMTSGTNGKELGEAVARRLGQSVEQARR